MSSSPHITSRLNAQSFGPVVHGTTSGYRTHKCRCPQCTWAATRDMKGRRTRGTSTTTALGSQRRILSLGSVGFSHRAIAMACGLTDKTVQRLLQVDPTAPVLNTTARAIADAFDRLAASPYPVNTRPVSRGFGPTQLAVVVNTAKARGGVTPMLWDDHALDDPDGQPVDDTAPYRGSIDRDRLLALIDAGAVDTTIAEEFGVITDSLYKHLTRAGLTGPYDRLLRRSGREAQPHLRSA